MTSGCAMLTPLMAVWILTASPATPCIAALHDYTFGDAGVSPADRCIASPARVATDEGRTMDDGLERIVLVDASDTEIGTAAKLDGHRRGLMHRALSVIVRDRAGRMLLQKRQIGKYHSGGLWTNTCCSHPRPGRARGPGRGPPGRRGDGLHLRPLPLMTVTYRADVGQWPDRARIRACVRRSLRGCRAAGPARGGRLRPG